MASIVFIAYENPVAVDKGHTITTHFMHPVCVSCLTLMKMKLLLISPAPSVSLRYLSAICTDLTLEDDIRSDQWASPLAGWWFRCLAVNSAGR
jgi:hypothetical protein